MTPIKGFCNCSMFCCTLLCVRSSFAIISVGKRELIVFPVSRDCCVALIRDATSLSAVCQCGISDHTHLLFLNIQIHFHRVFFFFFFFFFFVNKWQTIQCSLFIFVQYIKSATCDQAFS